MRLESKHFNLHFEAEPEKSLDFLTFSDEYGRFGGLRLLGNGDFRTKHTDKIIGVE